MKGESRFLGTVLGIFSLLASVSFVFYLMGLFYKIGYYKGIGVHLVGGGFDNNVLIFYGIYTILPTLLVFASTSGSRIFYLWLLQDSKKVLNGFLQEVEEAHIKAEHGDNTENNNRKKASEEIKDREENLKQRINNIENYFNEARVSLNRQTSKLYLFAGGALFIINIFSYLYFNYFLSVTVSLFVAIAFAFYGTFLVGKFIDNKYEAIHDSFSSLIIVAILIVFICPALYGYIDGAFIQEPGNIKVQIRTDDNCYYGQLITTNNDNYFISVDNHTLSIPVNEVKSIVWKTDDPCLTKAMR